MDVIEIQPAVRPFRKTVVVPGSKSITNRALPLAALADGETLLTGVLFADDTWQMINALQMLGYDLKINQQARTVRILGRGKNIPSHPNGITLSCGNSGSTTRFLTAMLTLAHGVYTLDGVPRMRQRPIDQLVDQLRVLGAKIDYPIKDGYPPIRINAGGLPGGGCQFADAKSSQYISAILMAAPLADNGATISLVGPVTSEPYVVMTLRMMEQFGVQTQVHDQCGQPSSRAIQVSPAIYKSHPNGYNIEPDASNASYFLAAAAIVPGSSITIEGLSKHSLQGDVLFAEVLQKMGATLTWGQNSITIESPADGKLHAIDIDMNHIPDMVQTLAVVALFAQGTTRITNVWNLRVKETDRLAALENELKKLGATIATGKHSITITPPQSITPASIKTYDDHRMAMSFAIAGLVTKGIKIEDPHCTAKTYPNFFPDLANATT